MKEDPHHAVFALLMIPTALAVLIAWRWPMLGDTFFRRVEQAGNHFSMRKASSVLGVGLLVIVLRLSLLPVLGVPVPAMTDEFCHLLAADTFSHGRLTNPPHPMSAYLETFYVIQSPTYMSPFPPGEGAAFAVGKLLGLPWIGVLLSVACLCSAITWCLQAWVPSRWALLGGVMAAAQFGASNNWMEHYFGGAVAGIGGALVIGSLPRIARRRLPKDTVLLALGVAILANSRPYEGLLLCIAVFSGAGVWFFREHKTLGAKSTLRLLFPFTAVMTVTLAFIAYDNWRITGHAFLLPWALCFRTFFSDPVFLWGKLGPPLHYDNLQFQEFFLSMRAAWLHDHTWLGFGWLCWHKIAAYLQFYAPPQIGLPILVSLAAMRRDKKIVFAAALCAFVFAGTLAVETPSFPHYLAPAIGCVYVLIVMGFRYLRQWKINNRSIGIGIVRALVVVQIALFFVQAAALGFLHHRAGISETWNFAEERMQIEQRLEKTPSNHLIIVRYGKQHDPNLEWVYNEANIDQARVVWAREIPGLDMKPLLNYFHGRNFWLLEPDSASGPKLQPLPSAAANRWTGYDKILSLGAETALAF